MFRKFLLLLGFTFLFATRSAAQDIVVNYSSGFYQTNITISISYPSDFLCYYTLDGSDPTTSSMLYSSQFEVKNRIEESEGIALIPTNPSTTFDLYKWRPPISKIPKATILKVALFLNGIQTSSIETYEYFIGPEINDIELPIISLQMDSAGLFDYETGIFVPGKDYDNNPNVWQPGNYFNRGNDWERIALFSFYDQKELKLKQEVNLQIHGGASRIMPSKSLRISAKENLGKAYLDYPFFDDRPWNKYKRILLRNGGQDFHRSLFRDALMHSLVAQTQPFYQATQPAVIFINGYYWGILNIRERYDKYYFVNYHQQPLEAIDYVEIAMAFNSKEGSAQDLENLVNELLVLNLSLESDYAKVSNQINIENYIDLHISKVYAGGTDWSGNNERIFRVQDSNQKWNWMASDYDDGFRNIEKESFIHATNEIGEDWPNPEWSTRIFRSLMQNENFANQYKNRLRLLLRTIYHPDQLIPHIDSIASIYRNEMPRQINRWTYPASIEEWEGYITEFKAFAQERTRILLEQFERQFPAIYQTPTEVEVFPNPAQNELIVNVPKQGSTYSYEIFNSNGQKLIEGELANQYHNLVPLTLLSSGFYYLRLKEVNEISITKFEVVK